MSLAIVASKALLGAVCIPVYVEVHISSGLPSFSVVGLPDAGVRESRERVRSAILNSGFSFPVGRVTVNLAPADLPKQSGRFDLPIAIGILIASGQINLLNGQSINNDGISSINSGNVSNINNINSDSNGAHNIDISNYIIAGELSLTGALMPVQGALIIALSMADDLSVSDSSTHKLNKKICFTTINTQAQNACAQNLILPIENASIAANVDNINVFQAQTLLEVANHLAGFDLLSKSKAAPILNETNNELCFSQVYGQESACRSMYIAASGGHSILLSGPPGSGKSMLAQRLPTILPPLNKLQALGVAAMHNLKSNYLKTFSDGPPFRTPHHSSTKAALVGGGIKINPGEISLANHGVLFLDELPHFNKDVLESLREPLEVGKITISRASATVVYDADFQLVAAMNPCPCGWLGHAVKTCNCTTESIYKYRNRISGPLLDRIDLQVSMHANKAGWLHAKPNPTSLELRRTTEKIQKIQKHRQGCLNAKLNAGQIKQYCKLDKESEQQLSMAMNKWGWSSRVVHKTIRVARTIADMNSHTNIEYADISEAMGYRN